MSSLLLCALFNIASAQVTLTDRLLELNVDGEKISAVVNQQGSHPRYALILFPGGNGVVKARRVNGVIRYQKKGNFLLRARPLWVDDDFLTLSADSTPLEENLMAFVKHLRHHYKGIKVYLVGTSRGTFDVNRQMEQCDGKLEGFIFTSSLSSIWPIEKPKKSKVLIVHNDNDTCSSCSFSQAEHGAKTHHLPFMEFSSTQLQSDPCDAFSPHGYLGIEKEVTTAIKNWIRKNHE